MQTSTLSLATSIPATTRSFCAIIQLPSLLGPGSKPMQLFGLRKTPGLSHAPRQAPKAFEHERAQIQRRAVGENRPFAHSARFCGHKSAKKTVKTIARGMPGVSGVLVVTNARAYYHTTRGCGCSGARHSLRPLIGEGKEIDSKPRADCAARSRSCVWDTRCLKIESADVYCARSASSPNCHRPA